MRVGEKETSEQAAIVERYRDLFTTGQMEALREAESRCRTRAIASCSTGCARPASPESSRPSSPAREDELENAILAARDRLARRGAAAPHRAGQARRAPRLPRPRRARGAPQRRERALQRRTGAGCSRPAIARGGALRRDRRDRTSRTRRRGSRCTSSNRPSTPRAQAPRRAYDALRERWFERLLGPEREAVPTSNHTSYLRRLSPLESTYTKERSVEVCVETLRRLGFEIQSIPGIRLDLDDRPQKSPRACVIASDPPNLVHLITRAQGGLHDYQAFLHEAGHALHYAGCDPSLPYTFRKISRDHALTEIYSYIVEAISREPGWHAEHFGLSDEQAQRERRGDDLPRGAALPPLHREAPVRARVLGRFPEDGGTPAGYSERLTSATGIHYPAENYPLGHGFGLLLRRLPPGLDPFGPAPAPPARRGRRGLVAQPRDGGAAARALPRGDASHERGDRRRGSAPTRSTPRLCSTSSASSSSVSMRVCTTP